MSTREAKHAALSADQDRIVLGMITQAARQGNPCPSNERLAAALGAKSVSTPAKVVERLEAKGLIVVHRTRSSRIVKVVATGHSTAGKATGRAAEKLVMDMIANAADHGDACPSNTLLATALGMTPQAAIKIVKRLEETGQITVRRASQSRIVTITATGATTGGNDAPERSFAGRRSMTVKDRFAAAMANASYTNDLRIPCARVGNMSLEEGERLFAEICADLGSQAQ